MTKTIADFVRGCEVAWIRQAPTDRAFAEEMVRGVVEAHRDERDDAEVRLTVGLLRRLVAASPPPVAAANEAQVDAMIARAYDEGMTAGRAIPPAPAAPGTAPAASDLITAVTDSLGNTYSPGEVAWHAVSTVPGSCVVNVTLRRSLAVGQCIVVGVVEEGTAPAASDLAAACGSTTPRGGR